MTIILNVYVSMDVVGVVITVVVVVSVVVVDDDGDVVTFSLHSSNMG